MDKLPRIETMLDADLIREMQKCARLAAGNAHAPYSHFHVGAAVLDEQGRIFCGCNVENASFGLTQCAERNAVGSAICNGGRLLRAVLIYTSTESLSMPCGACRQVLSEFGADMEVHLVNHEGQHMAFSLKDLLPASFQFGA